MSNDFTAFIPEVWSKKLAILLKKNTVMKNLTNSNYEGEISGKGSVVHIRVAPTVPVNNYAGTCIYSELDSSAVDLEIDQAVQFGFMVEDLAKAQSDLNLISLYTQAARDSVEIEKDTRLLAHVADVDVANIIATSEMSVDNAYAKFVQLAKVLKVNNVTAAQKPYVVINPDIEAVLIQAPQFIQGGSKAGEMALTEGAIGTIAGLEVFLSSNMEDVAGTYSILAGHKEAITMATQLTKIETVRDKGTFGDYVRGLVCFGSKVVKPKECAVLIVTLA